MVPWSQLTHVWRRLVRAPIFTLVTIVTLLCLDRLKSAAEPAEATPR